MPTEPTAQDDAAHHCARRAQLLATPWDGDVERCLPALAHLLLPEHDRRG
jgi:hypothetical protein